MKKIFKKYNVYGVEVLYLNILYQLVDDILLAKEIKKKKIYNTYLKRIIYKNGLEAKKFISSGKFDKMIDKYYSDYDEKCNLRKYILRKIKQEERCLSRPLRKNGVRDPKKYTGVKYIPRKKVKRIYKRGKNPWHHVSLF